MEQFLFKEDLKLMYVAAQSFPEDILGAHQRLHSIVKNKENRNYFGISFPDRTGKIQYKAAVTENFEGEGNLLGLKNYLLKKGYYNYITIPNYKNDIPAIENAFKILLLIENIDKNGACVEWYFNDQDVKCMVRLE